MAVELTEARTKDGIPVEHYHQPPGQLKALVAPAWWCSECGQEVCPGCYRGKRCPHWPEATATAGQ